MTCPICANSNLSSDFSVIEKKGKRVRVQGTVYAIVSPDEAGYPPFSDWFTVSIYPRKGKVKYLKFKTRDEQMKWGFTPKTTVIADGCMHIIDGKELIFDVTKVDFPK